MTTILIVDDMAVCREPMAETLRVNGYNVVCADNGHKALAILNDQHVDLVLLDVHMPELDGIAVLRTMRRHPNLKSTPVVLLTDCAEKSIVLKAAEFNVKGYLLKSNFSLAELLSRVERSLGAVPVGASSGSSTYQKGTRGNYAKWRIEMEKRPEPTPTQSGAPGAREVQNGKPTGSKPKPEVSPVQRLSEGCTIDELEPVITKKDLIALVNEGLALRPLGATVQEVTSVTANSGCSAEDVTSAVSRDQALSIRLLKLANTSAYSRGKIVDSVREAVQRLGIQEVRSLVMTLGVLEQFEGAAAEHVDSRSFWEHSMGCGLAASALAKARKVKNVDDYFLWGMLHDMGRLILMEHASDAYSGVWSVAKELNSPLEPVEPKLMLLDHCNILEQALEHWEFPRTFITPVVNHHSSVANLARLGTDHVDAAATVALANRICHALLIGSSGNDVIYPIDDLIEFLKIAPPDTKAIVSKLPNETNDLKYTMLARANESVWPNVASDVKSQLPTEIHPLCISSEPSVDAFRMFFDRIATDSEEVSVNLGVIYLRDPSEFAPLIAKFDEAEATRSSGKLPVIVILAKGKLNAEDSWLSSRSHVVLTPPVRVDRFVATIDELLG